MPQPINKEIEMIPKMIPFMKKFPPKMFNRFYGGRWGGKSHSMAKTIATWSLKYPGLKTMCCRETMASIKDSCHEEISSAIQDLGVESHFQINKTEIIGINKSTINYTGLLGHHSQRVKGMSNIDIWYIDEAAYIGKKAWQLLLNTMRNGTVLEQGILIVCYNPDSPDDPVHVAFESGELPPEDVYDCYIIYKDNPFCPPMAIKRGEWLEENDYERYENEFLGYPLSLSEDLVYKGVKPLNMDDQIPEDAVPLYGADWGHAEDPTVLLKVYIIGDVLYVADEAFAWHTPIDEIPALFAGDAPNGEWDNPKGFKGIYDIDKGHQIRADHDLDLIKHLKEKFGFNIVPATKGTGSIKTGISFCKNYKIRYHPERCPEYAKETRLYKWHKDPKTDLVDSNKNPIDKNNHGMDCKRYAVELVRKQFGDDHIPGLDEEDNVLLEHFG